METRSLGRSDLRLSSIALGTWGLAEESYGRAAPGRLDEVIAAAIEEGVTTFDVAPLWGDGEAERRVGDALAETGLEDAVVITRAGVLREDGLVRGDFDEDALVAQCEASLERLGRDVIDVWLLHNPGDEVLRQEGWRAAVDRLEDAGKVRAWGVSVGDEDEARLAIKAGAHAICLPYSMLSPYALDDLVTELATSGCGVIARTPLLYGMLAGQWSPMKEFEDDDHRAHRWSLDAFEARIRQVDDLRFLVGAEHRDLATAALRYVMTNTLVSTAAVGARTPRQIKHAVAAVSGGPPYMGDDDLLRIAKVLA